MDQEIRAEVEKLHGRINDLKERVVTLEAQNPHINSALARIEKNISDHKADMSSALKTLNGHLSKAVWVILGLFLTALWKLITSGAIPGI